ncbi:cysteine--tRNA ligase [Arcanobacterium phocae]|uniref:cysteine--tRNA ligase n=1 Tax=Arcanobacterium phocae TaxID=131112 RepID=UPI001C0EF50F|nr:cysteine--tRNA ligase [Arcanobacterium phocae]
MALHIYDSATRSMREFTSLTPGKASIYLCGATVQGSPHIGHMRSALAFDVLVRWLRRSGYETMMVRNVTDIDDKILAKSAQEGREYWAHAYKYENEFTQAYDALGVLRPTYEPRATGHIPEMVAFIARLIERGHAYAGDPGNVYFDVASLPDYGSLTRQTLDDFADDDVEPDKRNPRDFALWKAAKPGEPETASWETPWGRGRPGWHLECSAMAGKYLGESFDIHAGGIDLRFPHHENEQAQSHAAGYGFAQYWMHNAWVTIDGEKMSKSLGNSLIVSNILQQYPAVIVRLALGTVHYRSTVAYSERTLTEAGAVWDRLAGFVQRSIDEVGEVSAEDVAGVGLADLPEQFVDAMDDDLNVSAALAVIHEHVTSGNNALAAGEDTEARREQLLVRAMLDVLGLDPCASPWREKNSTGAQYYEALDALVHTILADRAAARTAKDWARADSLRDSLQAAGIHVEDSAAGARWKIGDK